MSEDELENEAQPPNGRRGGINQRAVRSYGFYARKFKEDEIKDLAKVGPYDLDGEIEVMRVLVRRVFEAAGEQGDFEDLAEMLGGVTLTAMALARLLHTRMILQGKPVGEFQEALQEAIKKASEEFK